LLSEGELDGAGALDDVEPVLGAEEVVGGTADLVVVAPGVLAGALGVTETEVVAGGNSDTGLARELT
jgi:hypothetical protein